MSGWTIKLHSQGSPLWRSRDEPRNYSAVPCSASGLAKKYQLSEMSVAIENSELTKCIVRSFGGRQALFSLNSIDSINSLNVWLLNLASSVVSGAHEEKQEYGVLHHVFRANPANSYLSLNFIR